MNFPMHKTKAFTVPDVKDKIASIGSEGQNKHLESPKIKVHVVTDSLFISYNFEYLDLNTLHHFFFITIQ